MLKETIKNNRSTFILSVIALFLLFITFLLPSKHTIKEISAKKIEKNEILVDTTIYFAKTNSNTIEKENIKLVEATYENLLKKAIENVVNKFSEENNKKIKLLNIFYGDNSIYFELNDKNVDPLLVEAIKKTTENLIMGVQIYFI